MGRLPWWEESRRMKVYAKGLTDAKSARILGLRYSTYAMWRTSRKLPAWRPQGYRESYWNWVT